MTLNPTDFTIWGLEGYREELTRIKGKVLKKVRQLMLSDYVHYLLRNKKHEKIKINHRIVDIILLLIRRNKVTVDKFFSSPELTALYRNVSTSTRVRDLNKMILIGLVKIDKANGESFIEPNFQILERIHYNV